MNLTPEDSQVVAVGTSPTLAGSIRCDCRGMQVHIPTPTNISTITWHSYAPKTGTWHPAKTEASLSTAVVQTGFSAGDSFPMPSDLFSCSVVCPVGNAAGTIEVSRKG